MASFATDGDYNNYDLPMNYSQTKVSNNPYLQVDLEKRVPVDFVVVNFPMLSETPKVYKSIQITLGKAQETTAPCISINNNDNNDDNDDNDNNNNDDDDDNDNDNDKKACLLGSAKIIRKVMDI